MGSNCMSTNDLPETLDRSAFLAEASRIGTEFGWKTATFEREDEAVCVAAIPDDSSYDRLVWVDDTGRKMLRCMMIGRLEVPKPRLQAIFELCARINHGLPFGCLEYAFDDRVLVFRDSADLDWAPAEQVIKGSTLRVLKLGERYAAAIRAVLDGAEPEAAVRASEAT